MSATQGAWECRHGVDGRDHCEECHPGPPDVDALLTQLHERHGGVRLSVGDYVPRGEIEVSFWVMDRPLGRQVHFRGSSLREALQKALGDACEHEWVDASNEAVISGEMCPKCGAIRAAEATP